LVNRFGHGSGVGNVTPAPNERRPKWRVYFKTLRTGFVESLYQAL